MSARTNILSSFLKHLSHPRNRRKFKRVRAPFLLKYHAKGETGNLTNVRNLSVGGTRFTAHQPFPKGLEIELEFNLPISENPVRVEAKVLGSAKLKASSAYRIAAKFIRIRPKDRTAIRLLVERMLRDKRVKGLVDR